MSGHRYFARDGRVYVEQGGSVRETSSAVTANGTDLERFDAALEIARRQRAYAGTDPAQSFHRDNDPHPGNVED